MSFVYPPTNFRARAHPLGAQCVLKWGLPTQAPDAYVLFLLKKEGADLTPSEFDDFVNGTNPNSWPFEVFELAPGTLRYADFDVVNGTTYYYRLTLRDDTTSPPSYSNPFGGETIPDTEPPQQTQPAGAFATPQFSIAVDFPDAKALLIEALGRVQSNRVGLATPELPIVDATIYPHQALKDLQLPAVSVVRANNYFDAARVDAAAVNAFDVFSYNSVFREFMGNQLDTAAPLTELSADAKTGLIEQDNLLVVWRCDDAESRDSISNTLRGARAEVLNYLHEHGVMEIRTAMGSDFVVEGTPKSVYGGTLVVQCRFESRFTWLSDLYVGDPVNESTYFPPYGNPPYQTTLHQTVNTD